MVLYNMGITGAILVEPMRNRSSGEMVRAYSAAMKRLHDAGVKPSMHILDNECSEEFKDTITKHEMKYHLAPPMIIAETRLRKPYKPSRIISSQCSAA